LNESNSLIKLDFCVAVELIIARGAVCETKSENSLSISSRLTRFSFDSRTTGRTVEMLFFFPLKSGKCLSGLFNSILLLFTLLEGFNLLNIHLFN